MYPGVVRSIPHPPFCDLEVPVDNPADKQPQSAPHSYKGPPISLDRTRLAEYAEQDHHDVTATQGLY